MSIRPKLTALLGDCYLDPNIEATFSLNPAARPEPTMMASGLA